MSRLILYFTVGYPDRATFGNFVSSLSSDSVDYVEFGFPSRDPKYDGPLIRKTHSIAEYEGNGDYSAIFRHITDAGIRAYSLAYVSDIIDDFSGSISFLKDTGFSGILMPDLLIDYFSRSGELISRVHEAGLEVIPFFNPSTPDRVIMKVAGIHCNSSKSPNPDGAHKSQGSARVLGEQDARPDDERGCVHSG